MANVKKPNRLPTKTKGPDGPKRPKSRMPIEKQAMVLARAAMRESERDIAKAEGISRDAVRTILSSTDVNRLRWEAASIIANALPAVARKMVHVACKGDVTAGINLLKGLRVLNSREDEQAPSTVTDLQRRSAGELEYFATHGRWPSEDGITVEEPKTITLTLER